ncbi:MAG TPA: serine hydrolase [Gemmatimonadaceae bacterium]|nr:serine hydrolase [Gemmatimonadaceae bacterium]
MSTFKLALAVGLLAVTCATGTSAQGASTEALAAAIRARIASVPGAEVAVSYRDLANGDSLEIDAGTDFHAASTMKIPVMLEVLRSVEAGRLRLDQGILLVNRFHSIVDGSPYSLDAGDDSDSLVYTLVGQRVPVRELMERMIVRSSNLATNALIALVGADRANATAHALGASHIRVLRGVEDIKAYDAGLNNTTTSADLAVLLEKIERGEALAPGSVRLMKEILLQQQFNDEIPAGLPPGTPVAHKTGSITATLHDAAIVYPPGRKPYVLVVLTRNIPQEKTAQQLIADISRLTWAHATGPIATAGGR